MLGNESATEAMKIINAQYDMLRKLVSTRDYGEEKQEDGFMLVVSAIVKSLLTLDGIAVELAGHWLWVTGDTKAHKDVLKAKGFFWARKKKAWYWRPSWSKSRYSRGSKSLNQIRSTYGSVKMADTSDNKNKVTKA